MECITATKRTKKATLFFETAIKQGNKGDEKIRFIIYTSRILQVLLKMQFKEAYEHYSGYNNNITTALNKTKKKINVAGINLETLR
jgi:hypothetical protein